MDVGWFLLLAGALVLALAVRVRLDRPGAGRSWAGHRGREGLLLLGLPGLGLMLVGGAGIRLLDGRATGLGLLLLVLLLVGFVLVTWGWLPVRIPARLQPGWLRARAAGRRR